MPAWPKSASATCICTTEFECAVGISYGFAGMKTGGWLLTFLRKRARKASRTCAQPVVMRCSRTPSASSSVIK